MGIAKVLPHSPSTDLTDQKDEKETLHPLPQHVAIIMDGNGRWASQQGLSRLLGHHRGVEALKRIIQATLEFGIPYLTIFAFSTENWHRPLEEINGLMGLLKKTLRSDLASFHENNIRLRMLGQRSRVASDILKLIDHAVEVTKHNTALHLSVALNYGGRDEIVTAATHLAEKVAQGILHPEQITEDLFSQALFTYDLPDPDLVIRTGDVKRISNFLLWQAAYAELVFLKTYWPDIQREDYLQALKQFQCCERKFGKISAD